MPLKGKKRTLKMVDLESSLTGRQSNDELGFVGRPAARIPGCRPASVVPTQTRWRAGQARSDQQQARPGKDQQHPTVSSVDPATATRCAGRHGDPVAYSSSSLSSRCDVGPTGIPARSTARICARYLPTGPATSTMSPARRPSTARVTGEDAEIRTPSSGASSGSRPIELAQLVILAVIPQATTEPNQTGLTRNATQPDLARPN
jgi:hypothetical protein